MNKLGNPSVEFGQDGGKDKIVLSEGYLPTNKIFKIDQYLRMYGLLSQNIEDYMQGNVRGKLKNPSKRMYSFIVLSLLMLVCGRNLLLAFISDPKIRDFLGEAAPGRPSNQITMTLTIWSIYMAFLCRHFYRGEKIRILSWLSPFAVFKGIISPASMGLDMPMTDEWFRKTKQTLNKAILLVNIQALLCVFMFSFVAYRRWHSHSVHPFNLILWTVILSIWGYFGSALIFITYGYFKTLAGYFRMRFRKVNNDIETIIAPDTRMKPNERCALLHHILNEHNEICMKIHGKFQCLNFRAVTLYWILIVEYNTFWSKYIMQTYFLFIAVICYTTFQAFFTYNTNTVRTVMFAMTLEASYILTKVSIAASRMANEVKQLFACFLSFQITNPLSLGSCILWPLDSGYIRKISS